ncbi:radical SAM protein [Actinoplanes nipponensis]|uniref:radical SAM protein n=1 Tax=Actinoplanes nipponensis TaxID=135950 RepID=UPI001940917D|nr:radical SAM protein [Actinoplanes nipponensis]
MFAVSERRRTSTTVRLAPGVRVRDSIAYVPRRDHFFALDPAHLHTLRRVLAGKAGGAAETRLLAELGICETDPDTPRRAFFGRSVVGRLDALPAVTEPLVVNCFATAYCPLRCLYCHADDLMAGYREQESEAWFGRVLRAAAATPAMVGVVTGGEPLARVERSERLIARLAGTGKAVVLDTSGVGDFSRLVPTLRRYRVHVRISLDSADPAGNDALRPANRRHLPPGTSSAVYAQDAIRRAVRADVPCSVQTVVTARNGDLGTLLALRDRLVGLGVTTWVLHVVVPVGKAARPGSAGLLAPAHVQQVLDELVRRTAAEGVAIDIRLTGTHRAPNSTLLISAKGELAVENVTDGGKRLFTLPRIGVRGAVLRHFRAHVDLAGHAGRYLNESQPPWAGATGATLPRA